MKLLRELNEQVEFTTEGAGDNKKFYIEGITLQGDIVNRNNRLYPMKVLVPVVEKYIEEQVKTNSAYGENSHPSTPNIDSHRVSHRFVSLTREGNNYIGKALVSNTPMGQIVRTLLEEGGRLGLSSRGAATLVERSDKVNEVQSDFMMATAGDVVISPSAPEAYITGVMEEAEWVLESNGWTQKMNDQAKTIINKTTQRDRDETFIKLFEQFLTTIQVKNS